MPVSLFMLQNFLIRSLAINPSRSLFLTPIDDNLFRVPELFEPELPTAARQPQLLPSLRDFSQIAKRFDLPPEVQLENQPNLEVDNRVKTNYPNTNRYPSASVDFELDEDNRLHSKRNCHVIKCPKISQATFGSDGKNCFEFLNSCFLAMANCTRYNSRQPRLKEVKRKECHNIEP